MKEDKRLRRKRYSMLTGNRRFFENFKKENPEYSDMQIKEFTSIIVTFGIECIMKQVIENGNGILLPQKLGQLRITTFKANPNRKIINHAESKKQKRPVYIHNFETDGVVGMLKLINKNNTTLTRDLKGYDFKPSRMFKKMISQGILQNYKLYQTNK